jgi:hypothetical protein
MIVHLSSKSRRAAMVPLPFPPAAEPRNSLLRFQSQQRFRGDREMGKALLLWLIGIPIPIIIVLFIFHVI